ncbi:MULTISPECIES: TetR/AcrR family transcriptional regulator [Glycomyces]|uniref:AcrR family transcriptional regulator n=2 Tax=Glycomyces TaxID=58113 RepID=A0A9X3PKY7_9ACTN|nr:TetR family transcriptional regulator [Glycomyces lechevalierae]MDA1385955.1 TetR family transcriptional regulator [Glycomyces lechevalierae]MDR7340888.1 AcrR family transcriptional regulator [Glycomyces lechevalierae]
MTTFQRARSAEQREHRREAILETAAGMLEAMPVAELSLNELARRVGLAKSNVLRYFESREAVLLELLDRAEGRWLAELPPRLEEAVTADVAAERAEQLAAAVAASLTDERILCDLLSAQAAVLERNVSAEVALRYKRAATRHRAVLTDLIRRHLPETGDAAEQLCRHIILVTGAVATHARPSASVVAAYEADPAIGAMRIDFTEYLRTTIATLAAGTLARAS